MVGGFGSNKYLREYLGKKFPTMKFIQPTNAYDSLFLHADNKWCHTLT